MRRIISFIILLLSLSVGVHAETFEQLRARAAGGIVVLPQGTTLEGVVVSDRNSHNMATNPNVAWNDVDLSAGFRTVYVQSEDGRFGFRFILEDVYFPYSRFSKVKVDLCGAILECEGNPERYTISGLGASSFVLLQEHCHVAPKLRHIADLSDEDIYTYVTLQGVELLMKHGAYTNVYEPAMQRTELNEYKDPLQSADVAATTLKDDNGDTISMLVNSKCTWRRRGRWLPDGVGSVSGIIVHDILRRYGGYVGRYCVRPASPADINIPMNHETSYETIVEWNWNRNYECALNLEKGLVEWVTSDELPADRILPDLGKGVLYTTCNASLRLEAEFDARNPQDGCHSVVGAYFGQGRREYGAVCFTAPVRDWYVFDGGNVAGTHAVMVETSTKGFHGKGLTLDFTWVAGRDFKAVHAYGFPAEWCISYSLDGRNWMTIDRMFILRPMFWNPAKVDGLGQRYTSYDAAVGFVEQSVRLPDFLLDKEKLMIRIAPTSDVLTVLPEDPSADINKGRVSPDIDNRTYLNFGLVSLKAIK